MNALATPLLAADQLEAVRAAAEQRAQAALGVDFVMRLGAAMPCSTGEWPLEWNGPGQLAGGRYLDHPLQLFVAEEAAAGVAALAPDFPWDEFVRQSCDDAGVQASPIRPVTDAAEALVAEAGGGVLTAWPLELLRDETEVGILWLVSWAEAPPSAEPASSPFNAAEAAYADPLPPPAATPEPVSATLGSAMSRLQHVPVQISVRLAEKRMPLSQMLQITPGSLITFNKSCDDLLEFYVNNRLFGLGEAVKLGENFGIKISLLGRTLGK